MSYEFVLFFFQIQNVGFLNVVELFFDNIGEFQRTF